MLHPFYHDLTELVMISKCFDIWPKFPFDIFFLVIHRFSIQTAS